MESENGTTYSSYLSRREVNLEPRNVDINSIGQCEQKKIRTFSQKVTPSGLILIKDIVSEVNENGGY